MLDWIGTTVQWRAGRFKYTRVILGRALRRVPGNPLSGAFKQCDFPAETATRDRDPPNLVFALDQIDLPLADVSLERRFALDCMCDVAKGFIVDEQLDAVAAGELRASAGAVSLDSPQ